MGRERREGEIEPVTGKEGEATGSQERSPGVDDPMCYVLGAGTERKHGKNRACKVCACEPSRDKKARDGGLSKAEHPRGLRGIQPFGQRVIRTLAT